jgi:cell division protein FtsW (lipid II flippase)
VKPVRVPQPPHEATARRDPSWRLLYRVGAASAWLFVGMLVAAIVLVGATPAPPTSGGTATLDYIAGHRTLYLVHQQLWLVPGLFGMVTYLALYPALKDLHRSLAALGTAIGGGAWALTLAIPTTTTGAPALVYLSDQFTATTDPARRTALAAAAETLIAQNRTPMVVGPLTAVGLLIVSIVMLRGVFGRAVAYLGIATGVLGIAGEALRFAVEGGYGVYGVLLLVWTAAVGWKLYQLGTRAAADQRPAPSPSL